MPSQILLKGIEGRPLTSCVKYNMRLTWGKPCVVWYPLWATTHRVPIDLLERYLDKLRKPQLPDKCSPE